MEFLWYDPAIKPAPIADLPLSRVFPDLGLAAMRNSWERDGVVMAFKCGAPNGVKAWQSGHALNSRRAWQTLNAGHDHPDANSFIIISGDDYVAVDDGYAKEKRSRNHSTLLVDGSGQYAGGSKNAFRDLDANWGARLEANLACGAVGYARGEAARAYAPDLGLRQFTREVLFLAGDAVVMRDAIDADRPVNITRREIAGGSRLSLRVSDEAWVRLRCGKPAALRLNGCDCDWRHDEATGMIWLRAPAGKSELEIHAGRQSND